MFPAIMYVLIALGKTQNAKYQKPKYQHWEIGLLLFHFLLATCHSVKQVKWYDYKFLRFDGRSEQISIIDLNSAIPKIGENCLFEL